MATAVMRRAGEGEEPESIRMREIQRAEHKVILGGKRLHHKDPPLVRRERGLPALLISVGFYIKRQLDLHRL